MQLANRFSTHRCSRSQTAGEKKQRSYRPAATGITQSCVLPCSGRCLDCEFTGDTLKECKPPEIFGQVEAILTIGGTSKKLLCAIFGSCSKTEKDTDAGSFAVQRPP
jgi:hypothetical protein